MILLGFLISFFCFMLSFYKDKNIISPAVIMSLLWSLSYFLQFFRSDLNHSSPYYLIFSLGVLFFCIGFYLSTDIFNKLKINKNYSNENIKFINLKIYNIMFYFVLIVFIYYFLTIYKLVINNFSFNVWQSIRIAKSTGLYFEPTFIEYGRVMIICFTLFSLYLWLEKKGDISSLRLIILFGITLVFCFTAGNRGILFLFIISSVLVYIITKQVENKKIIILLSILLIVILFVFIVTTFLKFIYEDQSDRGQFILEKLRLYFTTSMPSFVQWAKSDYQLSYGANTFNFFVKILNSLGFNLEIQSVIQPFIWINDDYTNVYTIFQYYSKDFGIFYSLIVQFVFGIIYGNLFYKVTNIRKNKVKNLLFLATIYFPLLYQFFDDKYFSLTSTWIQIYIWYTLFEILFISKDREVLK
ncbi:O-antigen polymerase [Vagococcus fluvialis]|uniref:O-antigen polymerase n=1 Tax=Vagococcus fluvialis TaxID=2738 RepID=UPI003B2147B6